jgi:hypothetical protein
MLLVLTVTKVDNSIVLTVTKVDNSIVLTVTKVDNSIVLAVTKVDNSVIFLFLCWKKPNIGDSQYIILCAQVLADKLWPSILSIISCIYTASMHIIKNPVQIFVSLHIYFYSR